MSERSQVSAIGGPKLRSWDDYESGCLATYGGGYHEQEQRDAFHHGISTVFNLLRAEFPPAESCKSLEAQKPVEFLVGDEVGLSEEGFWYAIENDRKFTGVKKSIITEADGDGYPCVMPPFMHGTDDLIDGTGEVWRGEHLRLISRPKKLTVADLPEKAPVSVQSSAGTWKVFTTIGDTTAASVRSYTTEHQAVQIALDFLNKIWAAKPEGV